MRPYKIQLVQDLKAFDLPKRHRFALEKYQENPTFSGQILFSDEAHYWLNEYVIKQNCRIRDAEQPEEIQELPFHPEKNTVGYRAMIADYVMPEIEAGYVSDIWFQQDGAIFHISHQSMYLLREHFGEQIILLFFWCVSVSPMTVLNYRTIFVRLAKR